MRRLAKPIVVCGLVLFASVTVAQEGEVFSERNIHFPRDVEFGEETLSRGSYKLALSEVKGEVWFTLTKGGKEVARDLAIEVAASELPPDQLKAEVLKGAEYYRVGVRRGDKVYLMYFLFKGAKA